MEKRRTGLRLAAAALGLALAGAAHACEPGLQGTRLESKSYVLAYRAAPEVGKQALENVLRELTSQAAQTPPPPVVSAGRVGSRLGKVSELTMVVPLAPGGAERLRAFLKLLGGKQQLSAQILIHRAPHHIQPRRRTKIRWPLSH